MEGAASRLPLFAGMSMIGSSDAWRWATHIRRHLNFKAAAAEAQQSISLIVAGPRGDEVYRALQTAGPARDGALILQETLGGQESRSGAHPRVAIYCPDAGSSNGALANVAGAPYAICVLRTGESQTTYGRLATTRASTPLAPGTVTIYYLSALELDQLRKHVLPDIVRAHHDREIALAAAIPAFRSTVAAKLTAECAMASLQVAAASALADHIPVLGLITGGLASAGDTIVITALQMRMLLRIAAAYGKEPNISRVIELLPVVGGGYGWRALAREVSGFIPIAGIPIKAGIAYAGTVVVGQVAAYYYETGLKMPAKTISAVYRQASEHAKEFVRSMTARIQRSRTKEPR